MLRADSAALKIAVLPTEDCLPIVVAKELRLFDTLGVDVHLKRYHAMSECRIALTAPLAEGAAIDSTLMRMLQGDNVGGSAKFDITQPTTLTAGPATALTWKFVTSKKARISRTAQLNNRVIAADSHGESYRLAALAIDSLVKKKQHVFIIQIEDLRIRTEMLINGNIDAALLPEPYASKACKAGAKVINAVKSQPKGVIAFRTEALEQKGRKQQYDKFCKALDIANDSIKKYGKARYTTLLNW